MCRACDENIYGEEHDQLLENKLRLHFIVSLVQEGKFLYEEHFSSITREHPYAFVRRFYVVSVLTSSSTDEVILTGSQVRMSSFYIIREIFSDYASVCSVAKRILTITNGRE